jgi:hypothetical protein
VATDLDVDDDKEMAALEAAMQAEDQAHGAVATTTGDEPAGEAAATATPAEGATETAAADPPADEAAAAPADTNPAPAEPAAGIAGVLSKDGKTILPFAVVPALRRESAQYRSRAKAAEERAERAEQELADLKAGKKPAVDKDTISSAEIEEADADFPLLGKMARIVAKVGSQPAAPTPQAAAESADDADPLQDAIDAVPLLAAWQAADPEKFERAKKHDTALEDSPKWRDKPLAERFAHVAKLVAAEYDIQTPAAAASPAPAPTTRKNPAEVIQNAARAAPNTLSDFKGGAPDPAMDSMDRMPPERQMRRFEDMTDAEIDAYLRKAG